MDFIEIETDTVHSITTVRILTHKHNNNNKPNPPGLGMGILTHKKSSKSSKHETTELSAIMMPYSNRNHKTYVNQDNSCDNAQQFTKAF